jgi:hypothetical protein
MRAGDPIADRGEPRGHVELGAVSGLERGADRHGVAAVAVQAGDRSNVERLIFGRKGVGIELGKVGDPLAVLHIDDHRGAVDGHRRGDVI